MKPDFNSLFCGMNLSNGSNSIALGNRKLVETSEPLVCIENTANTTSPGSLTSYEAENSNNFNFVNLGTSSVLDFATPTETGELKSNTSSCAHKFTLETENVSCPDGQTSTLNAKNPPHNFDLLQINGKGTIMQDFLDPQEVATPVRAVGNERNKAVNCGELDLLNLTHSSMTPNPTHMYPNRTVLPTLQNPNDDLLCFNPESRTQALPGGLVLPMNTSSASQRRPFPKDMKSETGGFHFIRNSRKADAFSFINDEIQANKCKQK